jgi:predicted ATPase/class 3 adenylate cyclase
LAILDRLVEWYEQRGEYERASAYAWRQVELEPWQEEAHRQLMRLLALSGQRSAALAQYETCRRLLAEELGVEPGTKTTELYERIRDGVLVAPGQEPSVPGATRPPISHRIAPDWPQTQLTADHLGTAPLEGERRMVTVLLADLEGPLDLLECIGTEAWAEVMEEALRLLSAEVDRYGGQIDQLRGDQLAAFFVTHEDDPERAVLALLAMQKAFADHASKLAAGRGIDLRLRAIVNTGEAIVTTDGSRRQHSAALVIGEAIVLARCIREAASLKETALVSENTYRLVAPLFAWQPLGEIAIEGASQPLAVYRPLAHHAPVDKGRGIASLSSPLVGRQAELRALQDAVQGLRTGVGGIVTLVGEAGIGKSRLLTEVRRLDSVQWIEGRCLSYQSAIAYHLWLDVLSDLLDVVPDASPIDVCNALARQVRVLCLERFDAVYPPLAWLMSLPMTPDQEAALRGLDAESLQAVAFRAIEMLLQGAARQSPLVVVCEDLHWADSISLALLERLLALTDCVPLLFVCVFRPERTHGCWQIIEIAARLYPYRHVDLRLDPLSATDSERLVGNLLRGDEGRKDADAELVGRLPPSLREQVIDRAEGNPFYVEEIVRSLIDSGVITYDDVRGHWAAAPDVTGAVVPDTLNGMLMSRVDRLPEAAKRVLQVASVVGRIFTYRLFAPIAETVSSLARIGARGPGVRTLDNCLATLQRERMIRERAGSPEREFVFEHQLTLDAVYGTLLKGERRVYHRRTAEVLEQMYVDRIEEQLGPLAYHWERAGETEQAITYLRRAGERAAAQYANAEAEDYYSRALDLTPEDDLSGRYALLLAREEVRDLLGEREAQHMDLALLKELAEALGDRGCQASAALRQAHYAIRTSDYAAAANAAQVAIRWALEAQDVASEAAGYREWGRALFYRHEYGAAREKLDRALALARDAGLRSVETDCLQNLGAIYLVLDDYATASTFFEEKLYISREAGDRISEGVALRGLGVAAGDSGEYAEAIDYLKQSLHICRETGNRRDEGWALLSLGDLYWAAGDYPRAKRYHEQCLDVCRVTRDQLGESRSLLVLGDISRIEGYYAQARTCFERALGISREIGAPIVTGFALTGLGVVFYDLGDLASAEDHLKQAVALREELGGSIADPMARLTRVHLLRGHLPEAQACADSVLSHLEDPASRDSYAAPVAYLNCYRVLCAQEDPRAGSILDAAHSVLQERAARIHDEELRRSFLENVPAHREILAVWEEEKGV